MKEELIKIAKEKGFESTFLYNQPMKYSSKEELRWLFWMTELQAWLRENYKIHITIHFNTGATWSYFIAELKYEGDWGIGFSESRYKTFEDALEQALIQALNLIKPKEQ